MIHRIAILLAALVAAPLLRAQDAGVTPLELKPSTNPATPLAYDKNELTCKAGAKVKLTMNNTGSAVPQPHNIVLCKVGADSKVMAAAMALLTDPKGMEKAYVPESPDVIAHTKFAQPGATESVEFTAPMDPGDYPFFCTFPGHAVMMKGVLKVTQ
jgi:azurin